MPVLAWDLLGRRDYRSYWLSTTSFALGIWSFMVAIGYSAKELSDSPLRVSLVSVAYFVPIFLLALPSGVLADTFDRKRVVVACRTACAGLASVLALLAALDALSYPALVALCFLVGCTVVLEVAARQVFVTHIVEASEVAGAAALGSVQGGLARVVGPLVAGLLIALSGEAAAYAFFALANAHCAWAFGRIHASGRPPGIAGHPLADLLDGLSYLRRNTEALAVVLVAVLTGVVGWLYIALLPSVNADVLDGGAVQLAVLSAAIGVGSVPPSVLLALRAGSPPYEGAMFFGATVLWGLAVVAYAVTESPVVAVVALTFTGVGSGLQQVLVRTLLLRLTEPAYHGRVMGTLMLAWGANIVGTLVGGGVAERYGVAEAIAATGILIVVIPLVTLALRPSLWRL